MQINKLFFMVLTVMVITGNAFAAGTREEDFHEVTGKENWEYTFDISDYETGLYNLIIRGTDKAGNVYYVDPINVFIDPNSDLPIAHISSPTEGMRVGTNLNIVGTCIDDDAVASVEVQIDDGDFRRVEGTEFWSYYLAMSSLEEGEHTIMVKGTDVNGIEGPTHSVKFNYDKNKPLNEIYSHENGVLFNSNVSIQGSITDKNGINALYVSRDGGETFESIGFHYKNEEEKYFFDLHIDVGRLDNGPQVYWFKSVDMTGSAGYAAFLFFVDNQRPVIEVLTPAQEEKANGRVVFAGKVTDDVGIKSFQYQAPGQEPAEIPLTPGNPYWTQEVDFLELGITGTPTVKFIVEDLTGNRTEENWRVQIDVQADQPVLTIAYPQAESRVGGDVLIGGFIHDDDGVQSVTYQLDDQEAQTVNTGEGFTLNLGKLVAGRHRIKIKAVDIFGTEGKEQELQFFTESIAPVIAMQSVQVDKEVNPYYTGMLVEQAEARIDLIGKIDYSADIKKAEYHFGDEKWKGLSLRNSEEQNQKLFSIEVPRNLEPGKVPVIIEVVDREDMSARYVTEFFYNEITEASGIYIVDARIDGSSIVFTDDNPVQGYVIGGNITSVRFTGESGFLSINRSERFFSITPAGEGRTNPIAVEASVGGRTFTSSAYSFNKDTSAPAIRVTSPVKGLWVQGIVPLKASVSDSVSISNVEYSLDNMENFINLSREGGTQINIEASIDIGRSEDGPLSVILRAVDGAGNAAYEFLPVNKDTAKAQAVFVTPPAEDPVNGTITIVGQVQDDALIDKVEFSDDGEEYTTVTGTRVFYHTVDFSRYETIPDQLYFRVTDKSQNQSIFTPRFNLDLEADKPTVEIQTPKQGETLRNDFKVSGMVFDDDGVKSIFYRLDDGEFASVEGDNSFSIPLLLNNLTDGEHTIEIKAADLGGVESILKSLTFLISKSEPESELIQPTLEEYVKDSIILEGKSEDPNGIEEVFISIDNGITFNHADGTGDWTYELNTRLLADGTQSVLVKAMDTTNTEGVYATTINIDNTPPQLILDFPRDGDSVSEILPVNGRVNDQLLRALTLTLSPFVVEKTTLMKETEETAAEAEDETAAAADEGTELPAEEPAAGEKFIYNLSTKEIFTEDVDIKSLPPGLYNLQIEAEDESNNLSYVSRNIYVTQKEEVDEVEIIFPVQGEEKAGIFELDGKITSISPLDQATLFVDDRSEGTVDVNDYGYFNRQITPDLLSDGTHTIVMKARLKDGTEFQSPDRVIHYQRLGNWVSIDSHSSGDFVANRPFLKGTAGYYLDPVERENNEEAYRAYEEELRRHRIRQVEVSIDNGKTFQKTGGTDEWQFRLQTQEIPDGELRVVVKATYEDNTVASAKVLLYVDKTPPRVNLLSTREEDKFNEEIALVGTGYDENGLSKVEANLRSGDKGFYKVPEFIQGLYLDAKFLGATYFDVGVGLSFFDDNVRLQAQAGMAPEGRFSGLVVGAKLLANVAKVPFEYFFGPDWEFFSMAVVLGANFSYFSMSGDEIAITDDGLIIGGVLGQLEFAKFAIKDLPFFNGYTLYAEYMIWFISSDVQATAEAFINVGVKIDIL